MGWDTGAGEPCLCCDTSFVLNLLLSITAGSHRQVLSQGRQQGGGRVALIVSVTHEEASDGSPVPAIRVGHILEREYSRPSRVAVKHW